MDNYNPMLVRVLKARSGRQSAVCTPRDLERRILNCQCGDCVHDAKEGRREQQFTLPSEIYREWASVASRYNVTDQRTPKEFKEAVSRIARNMSSDPHEAGRAFNILGKALLCVDVNGNQTGPEKRDYSLVTSVVDLAQTLAMVTGLTPRPTFAQIQAVIQGCGFAVPGKYITTIRYALDKGALH